jgi:hypothetical protein
MQLAIVTYANLPNLADDDRLLIPALAPYGITASPAIWNDPTIDWRTFDAVLLRSTWDYHRVVPRFLTWLDHLTHAVAHILNPPAIVCWNTDKVYLRQLAEAGVPVIPTHWGTSETDLATIMTKKGWDSVIVKPRHGATGEGAWTATLDDLPTQPHPLDFHMIQPIMPQIAAGELSLVYFGGVYSHTILKRAKAGNLFVQVEHGGTEESYTASDDLIAQGKHVLDTAATQQNTSSGAFCYARVDGILVDGVLRLMELELIEPSLSLHLVPTAPFHFARTIAAQLGQN